LKKIFAVPFSVKNRIYVEIPPAILHEAQLATGEPLAVTVDKENDNVVFARQYQRQDNDVLEEEITTEGWAPQSHHRRRPASLSKTKTQLLPQNMGMHDRSRVY
jgi:hypothetical protein